MTIETKKKVSLVISVFDIYAKLFLPYSIAFIDYLTDFRKFLRISKDYKEFPGMRWDFQDL